MNKYSNCIVCSTLLTGKQNMFCSILCKNKTHQSYDAQKERGLRRKLDLISRMGGGCCKCGYKKNLAALAFHHVDSTHKEFKLDVRSLSNRRNDILEKELSKCLLICHNCHSELHNPNLALDSSTLSRLL